MEGDSCPWKMNFWVSSFALVAETTITMKKKKKKKKKITLKKKVVYCEGKNTKKYFILFYFASSDVEIIRLLPSTANVVWLILSS
uniref:Uncharacterized protein n=1 Tax=Physcomitrium patens TaxID=3218 RepID=A0A2K1J7P1_PHYPA|nr:hypothetical protein PHYPA_020651 [Physcomitrium patens]